MGLLGGIISGAVSGAGQAGQAALASQQASDQQFNNQANLDEIRSGLELQKQLSLARFNSDRSNDILTRSGILPPPVAPGSTPPSTSSPMSVPAAVSATSSANLTSPSASSIPDPSGSSTTLLPPPTTTGNGPSWQISPSAQNAADLQSLAIMQNEMKEDGDPNNKAAAQREIDRLQTKIATNGGTSQPQNVTPENQSSSPVPAAANPNQSGFDPKRAYAAGLALSAIGNPVGKDLMEAGLKYDPTLASQMPTDYDKLLASAGYTKGSPEYQKMVQAHLAKEDNISPVSMRGPLYDPQTKTFIQPPKDIISSYYKDVEGGKGSVEPYQAIGPDGNPILTNKTQASTGFDASGKPIAGALKPGQPEFSGQLGTAAGKRVNDLRQTASDSPARVNVLDNLINLSKSGLQTGPNADWNNRVKGLIADLPGINQTDAAKNWQGSVSNYQEFTKFAMQNAQRAWQAAGGTGTDTQLEVQIAANVNNHLFPQAVQQIAQWNKAGELALQGKAAAQDNWLQAHGENPQSQAQFENVWRTSIDPLLYQLKTMPPAQAQSMVNDMRQNNPTRYTSLISKMNTLKQIGGL